MKTSVPNKPVQTIVNKIKRGNILFKHKLQRPEGVWNNSQKSLLIDSLLRGYLINPTYTVIEDGKQYVIDGVQRLYSIYTYITDGYRLSKSLDTVIIDNEKYEIAGKKFSKLDEKVQDELMSAQLQVCEISDYTDKDVREMFRRLNSGKPLNTVQRMTPNMSDELSDVVSEIVSHSFFGKVLTPAQMKSSVDLLIVIEVLMLSEASKDNPITSFRAKDMNEFVSNYEIDEGKIENIKAALNKLDESYDENTKIPKTSISFIIYAMMRAIKDKKSTQKLVDIINNFLSNYESNEKYKQFCLQGTSNNVNVAGRLDYWREVVKTL